MRIRDKQTLKNYFSNFIGKEMKIKHKKYAPFPEGRKFTKEKIIGLFVGFDVDNSLRFLEKTGNIKIIKPLFLCPWQIDEIFV